MAAIEQPETDPVRRLLRRPPAAGRAPLGGGAVRAGSRVVSVRPLPSAWLADHALEVADAAGDGAPGGAAPLGPARLGRGGPDFTAAREAAVLDLLAPTPVPAPTVVAADPDGAVCDVPALFIMLLPAPRPTSPTPAAWSRAWPPPDDRACFIHRDYHPANTLWTGGPAHRVADWIGGSWGRPRSTWGTCGSNWPPTSGWRWPTGPWPPTGP